MNEPFWKPKVGQKFRAYFMLAGQRRYHRLNPFVCTGIDAKNNHVVAGRIVFDVATWRFEGG